MRGAGPGPEGPGPDAVRALESARRRLYAPGGATAAEVAAFERLTRETGAPDEPPVAATPVVQASAWQEVRPPRRPRRRVLVVAGAALGAALLAVTIAVTRPAPITEVAVPALAGTTILGYGRSADPATGPASVTYQPQGYTIYQPRGRTVAVALRCVGTGRVRISAGARFDFRCSDQVRTTARRDAGPRTDPFLIMGTTVGDVVWSARIVLLDPPQTSGAIPSFEDTCDSCLSTQSQ